MNQINTKTIKVAIVGGGWFGKFHLENLLTMANVKVVALCSTSNHSLEAISKLLPVANTYLNYLTMLDSETDLDAIILCVPPSKHHNLEIEAAKRGIHLYIEKPIGITLEEVTLCQQAIADSNIICSVGYQNLYNPYMEEIKTFLADKKVGTVVAKWIDTMPDAPWWRVKEQSGGQLHEQGTHLINLMIYLFGDVTSVFSKARKDMMTQIENNSVEDVTTSIMEFKNGILANITCGCFVDHSIGKSEISLEIYTDKGLIKYIWDDGVMLEDNNSILKMIFKNGHHKSAVKTFITAIETNDSSLIKCNYTDSLKTFQATYAANVSMEEHKEIFLNELFTI